MKINIGNMRSMLSIVNSIVGTKPACHLSETEKRHVSVLIIQVTFKIFMNLKINILHSYLVFLDVCNVQCCQLSRIIQETPDFEPFLAVSRLESEISRIVAEVCYFL